jgi:hypothetical protein
MADHLVWHGPFEIWKEYMQKWLSKLGVPNDKINSLNKIADYL